MANESSPLLRGANGRSEPSNGGYHTRSDASTHSISIHTNGARGSDERLYMGYDKHALLNTPNSGLSTVEASRRLKTFGVNEIEPVDVSLARQLTRLVVRPTALLVWLAIALELALLDFGNVIALFVFQVVTSAVAWLQQLKTTSAMAAVAAAVKSEAVVVRDGVHQTINASLLVPGDRLTLSTGCVVPADCEVCEGSSLLIDQAPLTGDSFPLSLSATDSAKMGSTVVAGEGDAVVVATGLHTFLGKTALQLEGGSNQPSEFEKVSVRVTLALLLLVFASVAACFATLIYNREHAIPALSSAVTFVAVAVPLSMPAVGRLVTAMGSRRLLDDKIILTRLSSVEKLASMDVLCCDKTGTLTRNKLELQDDLPIFDPRASREDVLVSAALAAKWKEPPRDAVDTLVLNAIDLRPLDQYTLLHHSPFDPTSKRTESVVQGPTGRVFKVTKGSPESLLALAQNADDVRDAVEAKVMDLARRGISALAVARTEESSGGNWVFLGVITYLDPPRHDSKRMIEKAHDHGISVKLTTGDQAAIAVEACRQLGMGMTVLGADVFPSSENSLGPKSPADLNTDSFLASSLGSIVEAADGYAHVYPSHKLWILDQLRQRGWACGVTGDSVADVAAMKTAHVGVAVDGACDAARRVADVVLAKPGLSVIVSAVLAARSIFQRIGNYVAFQIGTTIHWAVFLLIATVFLRPGDCHFTHFVPRDSRCGPVGDGVEVEIVDVFFRLPITSVIVIGLTQRLTSIALLHDKDIESKQPHRWNAVHKLPVAISTGSTAAVGSVLLLFWALDSWNERGVLTAYGVGSLYIDQVTTTVFLQLALSTVLSVVASKSDGDSHFALFASRPSPVIGSVVVITTAVATLIAMYSPFTGMGAISLKLALLVWAYCIVWLFIEGAVGVLVSVLITELVQLGVFPGGTHTQRFARVEAQRINRIRLGLTFWSDESTVRDSFVVGRAVRSAASTHPSLSGPLGHVTHRVSQLELDVSTLRKEIQSTPENV